MKKIREIKARQTVAPKSKRNQWKMGSGCCKARKNPKNDVEDAIPPPIEDSPKFNERARTVDSTAVLEVDTTYPQDTIERRRNQILRDIGSFDLLTNKAQ